MSVQFSQTTRSLASDNARFAGAVWAMAALFLTGWLIWFFAGSVTVYEISPRARIEVVQTSHHMASLVQSKVLRSNLAIGAEVQADAVLLELDASAEIQRLREEEVRLTGLPPRIASLKREIGYREQARDSDMLSAKAALDAAGFRNHEADAALEFATEFEKRLNRLSSASGVPQVDVLRASSDTRKLSATRDALIAELRKSEQEAQARAQQNSAEIESLKRDVLTLESEVTTTQATIERLKVDIERHLIRAPVTGRVGDMVPLYPGAYIAAGQRLATIVPYGELMIVADFSPNLALGRVQPGQAAQLRLDGFPWAQYGTVPAVVRRVASEIRDNYVRIEFAILRSSNSDRLIQHGLPGSIEVDVEQVSPATLVLRSAGLMLSGSKPKTPGQIAELGR